MITRTLSINLPFTINSQYFKYLNSIAVSKSMVGESSSFFTKQEDAHKNSFKTWICIFLLKISRIKINDLLYLIFMF